MNDYLKEWQDLGGKVDIEDGPEKYIESIKSRDRLIRKYAFAIPDDKALDIISKYSPIIEIGAGTGYWAYLLRQRGVDIIAFDIKPPTAEEKDNRYFHNVGTWTEVLVGSCDESTNYRERSLFLCWPNYAAEDCLKAYEGEIVIYIGEWRGCTGSEEFHRQLTADFEKIVTYEIPQWSGIHDKLFVFRRSFSARKAGRYAPKSKR